MKDLNEVFIVGRAVDDIKSFNYNGRIKYSMVIAINYYSYRKRRHTVILFLFLFGKMNRKKIQI